MPSLPRISVMMATVVMAATMGCAGLPDSSRTGHAHLVEITDKGISPKDLMVESGDEILFSNPGAIRVWMYFLNNRWNALSCRRGFSYSWGNEESAGVQPNASVSLCLSKPGLYGYWVQLHPTDRGGAPQGQLSMQDAMPGAIIVTAPSRSN